MGQNRRVRYWQERDNELPWRGEILSDGIRLCAAASASLLGTLAYMRRMFGGKYLGGADG